MFYLRENRFATVSGHKRRPPPRAPGNIQKRLVRNGINANERIAGRVSGSEQRYGTHVRARGVPIPAREDPTETRVTTCTHANRSRSKMSFETHGVFRFSFLAIPSDRFREYFRVVFPFSRVPTTRNRLSSRVRCRSIACLLLNVHNCYCNRVIKRVFANTTEQV